MVDKTTFELLKKTVGEMDVINGVIKDSFDVSTARALEPVLGEVDFDYLSSVNQAKLEELVGTFLAHVRNTLENELELKAMDIKQLKS
jgi:hypothetical protein